MARRRRFRPGDPLPSVPDRAAPRGRHDEPPMRRRPDRMPSRAAARAEGRTLAELRLRVEELLRRREAPPPPAWNELGETGRALLLQLLDEEAIASHPALQQRVVATLGELRVQAAIPRLGQILASRAARPITRAQAANALGRMGDAAAVGPLARAMDAAEEVVRRQVARALGEIGQPEAVPHLQRLAADRSRVVADAAREALRRSGQRLGLRLSAPPARKKGAARRPRKPGLDRG